MVRPGSDRIQWTEISVEPCTSGGATPRFGPYAGDFTLDCDASDEGVGAVLMQEQEGEDCITAFGSQRLSKSQRNYSTTKKELLSCFVFVQHFLHYLQGKKFKLRTDHSSLQWLVNFRNPSGMLARWLEILGSFTFDIIYRSRDLRMSLQMR